jgi:hypothetical protein
MMSTTKVIVIVFVLMALGFSLYKRFKGKEQGPGGPQSGQKSGSSFSSHSEDDDYEPYSKSNRQN